MSSLVLGAGAPVLAFNLGGWRNFTVRAHHRHREPCHEDGNVTVNVMNVVQSGTNILLRYNGTRSGSGNFGDRHHSCRSNGCG